jgi:DNA-binding beta-propeller fold protein YncE
MRSVSKTSVLALVSLLLAACASAPSQESVPTTISVPTILPTPLSTVPLEERLLAAINIKSPDELTFVQGFIWVKTDDGYVVQVDPTTNSVVSQIKVDTTSDFQAHYCQGLGTDGTNLWACSASGDADNKAIDVVRIDPTSRSIVATVQVGKTFDQFNMPFLLNHIWVLTDNGSTLVGIDTTTNLPGPTIDLGARCFQVAVMDSSLLVTCRLDDLILRVDPERQEITEQWTFSSPGNIAATEHGIWVSQGSAVVRLDPKSFNPVATFSKLSGDVDFFTTEEAVWVRLDNGFLYRIDPASNQLAEQIISDQQLYNMGGILVTSDSIWTSAGDDDLVLRLSLK